MGRSQYAILGIGLVSVVMLSLMMKYFLKVAGEQTRSPVLSELTASFGDRLDAPCELRFTPAPGGKVAELTIYPLLGTSLRRLAEDMGQYVWRRIGLDEELRGVEVVCRSWAAKDPMRFTIQQPYLGAGRSPRTEVRGPKQPRAPTPVPDAATPVPGAATPATVPPAAGATPPAAPKD